MDAVGSRRVQLLLLGYLRNRGTVDECAAILKAHSTHAAFSAQVRQVLGEKTRPAGLYAFFLFASYVSTRRTPAIPSPCSPQHARPNRTTPGPPCEELEDQRKSCDCSRALDTRLVRSLFCVGLTSRLLRTFRLHAKLSSIISKMVAWLLRLV